MRGKPNIERAFGSLGSLFCQFVSGYLGRNPDRRGRGIDARPLWSMLELQELLDEWLIAFWLNRPHDGLRDPQHPGRAFTPNEKYAALVEAAGYVPVALGPGDYIELLPAAWRAVNAYGIKLNRRSYDSEELNPRGLHRSAVGRRRTCTRSATTPTTCPASTSAARTGGSPCSGSTWTGRRCRSASSPGTTPAAALPARTPLKSRSPARSPRCCAARTPAPKGRRNRR